MQPKHRWLGVAAGLLAAGLIGGDAQAQVALTGVVSAADEGPMEGVLVSAKKEGSTITTTVVSDQQGAFSFPSARLEPGKYTISIRAIGYRLDGAKTIDIPAGGEGKADLKLSKVKSLVPQLSNGEWLLSLPGADKQKAFLTMCVGCHTLQRVLTSNHDAAEFQQVGFDRRQCHAHRSVAGICPMLDRVVVGVRSRKLVVQWFDDRMRAFESELRLVDPEREREVELQIRRGVLQDAVGQVDPLDLVVEDHFLGDLRAAGAGGRYDEAPADGAALSLSNRRAAGTLQLAAGDPPCNQLVQLMWCVAVDQLP